MASERWKRDSLTVAFTNGVYDLLHVGHLSTITFASAQCDRLIVGITDDASAAALKMRAPIFGAGDRAALIFAIKGVDMAVVFAESELDSLIRVVAPDVLVKGFEYSGRQVVGAAHAGRVMFAPMVAGLSSSGIVQCILSRAGQDFSVRTS
jgi:D-beta-D-heptose 7-phosphate kinase/D-beta-D-heptose 1-phosphate adenosyltransferase